MSELILSVKKEPPRRPMNIRRLALLAGIGLAANPAGAAHSFLVKVENTAALARPAEVIVLSWPEVLRRLPGALIDHVEVRDAAGARIAAQVTNFEPDRRTGVADQLLFQHDFAAGEKLAVFTVSRTDRPLPPFPTLTFARYVPERLDDFAWENDRIAHRTYGAGLETAAAGRSRMVSSGLDVWSKRVRYPIVDRWYLKGHNNYHVDQGEGLDMYDTGRSRGCGGTGIWDGRTLAVSHNYRRWRVLANGPIRSVFELDFDPWDAGGVRVSETKRFTVDAGHNLDQIESTFTFSPPGGALTAAIGLGKHPEAVTTRTLDGAGGWLSLWEKYRKDGQLGTAILLSPGALAGEAEDPYNYLVLARIRSGVPLRYFAGAGWSRSGDFPSAEAWNTYLASWARRLRTPVTVSLDSPQP